MAPKEGPPPKRKKKATPSEGPADGEVSEVAPKAKPSKTQEKKEEKAARKAELREWRQQKKESRKKAIMLRRIENGREAQGKKAQERMQQPQLASPGEPAKKVKAVLPEEEPAAEARRPKKKRKVEQAGGTAAAANPEAFKVVVAGLKPGIDNDVAAEQMRQHFEGCGEIISHRVLRDRTSGTSRGIGFMAFSTKAGMDAAIEMNGDLLLGRTLFVQQSTEKGNGAATRKDTGSRYAGPGEKPKGCTSVIVKGLAFSVTEKDLTAFFKDCGDGPKNVTLRTDNVTGASRGIAFVDFDDEDAVDQAIEFHGAALKGRSFQMDYVAPRRNAVAAGPGKKPDGCTSVVVKGLAYSVNETDLEQVFKTCSGGPTGVRMVYGKEGSFRGMAFLDFATSAGVDAAVKLHGSELHGRKFNVDYAGAERSATTDGAAAGAGAGNVRKKPEGCTSVTVKNLPETVTEKRLLKLFAGCAGGPRSVNVVPKERMAFVNFYSEAAVDEAMAWDGAEWKGQVLKMGYVKPKPRRTAS